MEIIRKRNIIVGVYFSLLFILLLSVCITPLMIKRGVPLRSFIIKEDTLETILIVTLFGISFLILRGFLKAISSYRLAVVQAGKEKSRLMSRLAEAFNYIGTVNVEIAQIEAVLCGVECYPRSKREFRRVLDQMAVKAMTVASVPWLEVRMIHRHSGHTESQHAVQRPGSVLPSVTIGNRAILKGHQVDGLQVVATRQSNLDLFTVFILPVVDLTEEQSILIGAVLNQIEMLFMLQRTGCLKSVSLNHNNEKEILHDSYN